MAEGFRARHALEAIGNGTIIERRDEESRCLICGVASGLRHSPDFIGSFIHCVVRWDSANRIVIVTMYRPKSSDWVNQFTRRRS